MVVPLNSISEILLQFEKLQLFNLIHTGALLAQLRGGGRSRHAVAGGYGSIS
jgi:hypothetical protein